MKYAWKGLKDNSFVEGTIEADEREDAIFLLKKDGITVTEIDNPKKKSTKSQKSLNKTKIKDVELLMFTKKLTTMMKAGLAIVPAMEMLKEQNENPNFNGIIEDLLILINSGVPLSQALGKYPNLFDNVYVNLIKAGESSGNLDTFLDRVSINLEKSIKIKKSIKKALMYPIILLTVALLVVGVMMIFVVPVFVEIFGNAGIELPLATRIVMSISDFLRDWMILIYISLLIIGFKFIKKQLINNEKFMFKLDALLLKSPVVGNLIINSIMARITMVLSNLIIGGVNLVQALEIVKNSISNSKIQTSLERVKREIFSGRPLSLSLRDTKDFPETMCGFIEVGEETGKLNDMLVTVSNYYEEEFDSTVDAFSQLMEPIMIVFLGLVIGFILVAMYTPIFQMGTTI
ncbi:MAG: type II secretion system F family protein [Methylophilaceae bacterium]